MDIGSRVRSMYTGVWNYADQLQMGFYKGKVLYNVLGLLYSDWEIKMGRVWHSPGWLWDQEIWY